MNLTASLFSFDAVRRAAHRAARGKRSRADVARYLLELEPRTVDLSTRLLAGTWRPSPTRARTIRDDKIRHIRVQRFDDRIVHQALFPYLDEILSRRRIATTFACRVGGGVHAALRRLRAWSRTHRFWLRLDVRRYFASIDHHLLLEQWRRWRVDAEVLRLLEMIVAASDGETNQVHFPGDDLFAPFARQVGLPLGSLASQVMADGYLIPIDHTAKSELRIRAYLRYMDDLLLFDHDRGRLADRGARLQEACLDRRLRLHPWQVQPTSGGVGAVGYRVHTDQVRIRRTTVNRARRRLEHLLARHRRGEVSYEDVWASLRGTFAHLSHADTWRLRERMLEELGVLWPPRGQ